MSERIRIGNQTAISCGDRMGPFLFALRHGFDAFEWFADRKTNADGSVMGWDEADMDAAARAWIRDTGRDHGVLFTVHAPWQANPLHPGAADLLIRSIDFARDIGAALVNLHLYMDEGAERYVRSLGPVIRHAADAGLRLTVENTPHTTPEDFNATFATLRELEPERAAHVGMCLDIGHANLCATTRNNYVRFLDELAPEVPITHLHVHENYGDADSHLTLFTGPSRVNDAGVRAFLERLRRREYRGAMILEQWPRPPELLIEAANRLRALLGPPAVRVQQSEADFLRALVESARTFRSWRGRLQWLRDRFAEASFRPGPGHMAAVAVYLRFLATGELKCEEDGGHYRPNHSAEAAAQIEAALERMASPATAWILRRIYPYLPSWSEEFQRAEPLTRIRDIAHRNDIPADLKREIKTRLQNKLHRSAGPEDLRTSEEILARVTAAGAGYSPAFVNEFKLFHGELQEFFNATGLDVRLRALAEAEPSCAEAVGAFLALKGQEPPTDEQRLDLLERLTALRQLFAGLMDKADPHRRSQLRLADVGLEDYSFTLLSECANRLGDLGRPGAWAGLLRASAAALDNLRLSLVEPEECAALRSALSAWAADFRGGDRFHLLRLLATLTRARRLAESYTDRINALFPPRAREIGSALGVAEQAVRVFSEGDVRGHVVFQLSKLVELGTKAARQALRLPPWEAVVPGEASGTLVRAAGLAEVEGARGSLLVLLEQADGDAEIPAGVKGIVLGHPMPLLSHLGVRARQARTPFAAAPGREYLDPFGGLVGKGVRLRVAAEGLTLEEEPDGPREKAEPVRAAAVPEVILAKEAAALPLDQATPETCGAKAAGARRLLELAEQSKGLFRVPRGLAVPFGAMEACLAAAPALEREYLALQDRLASTSVGDLEPVLEQLRGLLASLRIPDAVGKAVADFFGPDSRLAVRSSANGEDLEHLAGAGLYESVVNVPPAAVAGAVARVWASLWTRRAAVSRIQAGIPHAAVRMAVLVQELVVPDLSFIMHTVNPLSGRREEGLVELAVGLGEVLASSPIPGAPYRLVSDRGTGAAHLSACADFSMALRPAPHGTAQERLDYSQVPLSADPEAAPRLGRRLAQVASFLEEKLGRPQDVEGVCAGEEIHVVQARPQQGL
jgi:phosphoglucan,water dikinase